MDSSSLSLQKSEQLDETITMSEKRPARSYLKTVVIILTWVELILGLSAISSAVFLNKRVPVLLYAFYGAYLGMFLWLLYTSCRSTYLKSGPINHTFWIFGVATIGTIGVVLSTFLTAPNAWEIAFISLVVFFICLVLFPFICAIFYCFLRGNFIMPGYMRTSKPVSTSPTTAQQHNDKWGIQEPDTSTSELQNGFHHQYTPTEV